MPLVKMTQTELNAEARRRFGDDVMQWAFACPNCGDVATVEDFPKDCRHRVGQECIGRSLGALNREGEKYTGRGCDWTAYGLFHGPWEIVMPDGHSAWSFPLAVSLTKAVTS